MSAWQIFRELLEPWNSGGRPVLGTGFRNMPCGFRSGSIRGGLMLSPCAVQRAPAPWNNRYADTLPRLRAHAFRQRDYPPQSVARCVARCRPTTGGRRFFRCPRRQANGSHLYFPGAMGYTPPHGRRRRAHGHGVRSRHGRNAVDRFRRFHQTPENGGVNVNAMPNRLSHHGAGGQRDRVHQRIPRFTASGVSNLARTASRTCGRTVGRVRVRLPSAHDRG